MRFRISTVVLYQEKLRKQRLAPDRQTDMYVQVKKTVTRRSNFALHHVSITSSFPFVALRQHPPLDYQASAPLLASSEIVRTCKNLPTLYADPFPEGSLKALISSCTARI